MTATLAVFHDVQLCDTHAEHPVTLITDGRNAYAHGPATDVEGMERFGTIVRTFCPEEYCNGSVEFDLATAGTWEPANGEQVRLMGLRTTVLVNCA